MMAVIVNNPKWTSDKSLDFVCVPFDWRVPDFAVTYLLDIYLYVESANTNVFSNSVIDIMISMYTDPPLLNSI